ncbi:mucin-3A isoform X2 [Dicentrarchus labrax]|uniref:mucin-3A isoform X2 n=1 Tax=Dicentrarchus labrax TaxID=13489 RepID=UPI0021F5FA85|nr:mucin-3A isoform X2 [Dicentrarchus labrax]
MFHENENKVPSRCSDGPSGWHMFAPSVRMKKPSSHVRHPHWLYIQLLVVILAGQASCNQTSAAPSLFSATTNAPTSVYYFVHVTVDVNGKEKNASEIKAWLVQVFQNNLESCLSPNREETTALPTSPQTTSASTYETTLNTTAATSQSNITTTAETSTTLLTNNTTTADTSTALLSNNTTTAATSTALLSNTTTTAATSTALLSNNTTTAATSTALQSNNTTTADTSTALLSNNTTTAATSTALLSNNTTTAATSTALLSNNTTTAATSTALQSNNTTTADTSTALLSNNTTTAATSTALLSNNTTTAAISTALLSNNTTAAATLTTLKPISTTAAATSTALLSNNTTAAATLTTLKSVSTTAAATLTTLKPISTTAAATLTTLKPISTSAAATLTTLKPISTTAAATLTTLKPISTSAAATLTTLKPISTSAAATLTTLKPVSTSAAATLTTLKPISTTAAATNQLTTVAPTTTSLPNSSVTAKVPGSGGKDNPNPNSNSIKRVAREILVAVPQTSGVTSDNTTGLFQGIEVTCAMETAIRNTNCTLMLKLKQSIPPCCILRTLCAANKTSSNITVVGKKADRTSELQNECNSNPPEENSCIYTGQTGAACEESGPVYKVVQHNSTQCEDKENDSCSCSAYCKRTDAYYTFNVLLNDPTMEDLNISTLINNLTHPPACSSNVSCPLSIIASEYKDAIVICGSLPINCKVILNFAHMVPICPLAAAVMNVIQSEEQITYNGLVTRAAICGNYSDNPLNSQLTYVKVNLKPANFCMTIEDSDILNCQNGQNVLVLLEEECVPQPFITPSPHVTTAQPNTTTSSVNVTSSPLNTTAEALNATTTAPNVTATLNTTTIAPNATTIAPNVTATLNTTTIAPNATTTAPNVTATLNTTTIAPNATTTAPNVTATLNTTTIAPNATTTAPNVTATLNTTTIAPNATTTAPNVTATLNTATTTTNVSVTPSEIPTTTESADSQANALLEMTRDVSMLNSSQVDQLVSQLENLLSGPNVSLALGNTSVHIVSNLLGASPETLSDSSNRIIGIVDTVALKLVLDDQPETLLSPAVAVSVKPADGTNFQETFFSISDPNNVQVRGVPRLRRSVRADSSIPQGSIRLPPSLTQDLTSEQQQLASRVQFNFYQESTVFQDKSLGERKLNSGILGASVANLSIKGLQDDVVIHLRNTAPVPGNFVAQCVFWDFTFNDGSGGWNSNGCSVRNSTDNETICGCNHLTSFAILLDLSREPLTSRLQATILTFITYIGCGISAIFLSITLLTYLAFGKLRKDIPSKILIQLCTALLLLNLVFLVDAWLALYPDAVGLCISTAWFLHYFLLVTFTWMGLEAVHMYLALVKVFNSYISHYMLKFSLVGWGVPMIVVIIVIAIDKDNYGLVSYGKFPDGTSDDFCWLKNDIAFYVAVVAYFCVIFLFNLVMFTVVLVQLCRIKRQNPHNSSHRTTMQDARSVVGITILLGLTWGFAFFAWGPVNLPFMYLFAIFNSLQGFFIFVFHCAVKENVRKQWRTYLCCGRMRLAENSEWSRTATQKTVKKSSVTRVTSLHSSNSSTSNNSSNSSTFLVSDSSELNGIGSPFEDRTITADEDPSMDVILNELNSQHRNR